MADQCTDLALPRGKWCYVDVWGRYGDVLTIERIMEACGFAGLAVRGPSQRGVGHRKLKNAKPTPQEIERCRALRDQGIQIAEWFWPVPDPHGPDDANIIIDAALEWAHAIGAAFVVPDMEDEWFGMADDALEFVPSCVDALHLDGLAVVPSTFRHWRHQKVPMEAIAFGDAAQLQVYGNRPSDCVFDGGRRGVQDFDGYAQEVVDWARERLPDGMEIYPAWRAYSEPGKVSGPRWEPERLARLLRSMPAALASFCWSWRQIASLVERDPRWAAVVRAHDPGDPLGMLG